MEVLTLERHYSQLSKSTPPSRRYSKGESSIYLQRMRTPGTFASPGVECEHRCGERNAHQHPKYRPRSLLPICALAMCGLFDKRCCEIADFATGAFVWLWLGAYRSRHTRGCGPHLDSKVQGGKAFVLRLLNLSCKQAKSSIWFSEGGRVQGGIVGYGFPTLIPTLVNMCPYLHVARLVGPRPSCLNLGCLWLCS